MTRTRATIALLLLVGIGPIVQGCGDDDPTTPDPPNRPPRIAAQGDTAVAVGDTLWLQASAEDDDGDALAFGSTIVISLSEFELGYVPDGGINELTGRFRFSPVDQDRPGRDITFEVRDGRGGADTTAFRIQVD
jgi:hypothetical protein